MTLTGIPTPIFIAFLALSMSMPFILLIHKGIQWLITRYMDKLKARYREQYGEDFDGEVSDD